MDKHAEQMEAICRKIERLNRNWFILCLIIIFILIAFVFMGSIKDPEQYRDTEVLIIENLGVEL